MSQSDSRTPRSFGRPRVEEPVVAPEKPAVAGPVQVVDGKLVLQADLQLVLPDSMLQGLYEQIRDVVALATADGMSIALGRPLEDVDGQGDGEPPVAPAAERDGPEL
jgi:hypothetical protein